MTSKSSILGWAIVLVFFIMVTSAKSWPVPDTGQTQCYIYDVNSDTWNESSCPEPGEDLYGQDGNYLINEPSFTKLDADGNALPDSADSWIMVRDNVTGLIWELKQNKDGVKDYSNPHDADNTYTWYDSNPETNGGDPGTSDDYGRDTEGFINALNEAVFGGHSDWRLPKPKELQTIVDYSNYALSIFEDYFPNGLTHDYWSSITKYFYTNYAWQVSFDAGSVHARSLKSHSHYVRAVRAVQNRPLDNLVINGDGTVTDSNTGLMWQQQDDGVMRSWVKALEYSEKLTLANYDDWRLPTAKELNSIVDYKRYYPSINPVFSNTMSSDYWSSTSFRDTSHAWRVHFLGGSVYYSNKFDSCYVRAVRAGQNRLLGHLSISSPTQGSKWARDDVMPIAWDTAGIGGNVSIVLSRDGGKTYSTIAEDVPNDGSFDWTVTGPGSVNCMLQIVPLDEPSKKTVQGLFSIHPISFTLTYTTGPNGSITGETIQVIDPDSDGTEVEAFPDTGYHFFQWSDGSTENPRIDMNVTGDITVTAEFAINQYSLSYMAGPNGSISGDASQTISHGSDGIEVIAIPNFGYHFVDWNDGVTTPARTDTNITENLTVTANFAIKQYTLSYESGPNGSITGETTQTVDHGENGDQVQAVPNEGFHFVQWSDGVQTAIRTDINVQGDIDVTAQFAINTFSINYAASDYGAVYGPLPTIVDHGSIGGSVIAVPQEGYHFVQWSDGVADNPRTDESVTQDIVVTAQFALNQYWLSYSAENGSIVGEELQSVGHGGDGTEVEAVPDPRFYFVKWSDGSTENPRTDIKVTGDVYVDAEFAISTLSGRIALTVTDFTDFPVPDALVTLLSDGSGESYETFTNDAGLFCFYGLASGDYSLTVATEGLTSISLDVTLDDDSSTDLGTLPSMLYESMYNQQQLDQAVADAEVAKDIIIAGKEAIIASMFTQTQIDEAVANAEAAKDEIISSLFTKEELDQAVAEAESAKDLIINEKEGIIAEKEALIESMFSQEQLDQAVADVLTAWDIDGDGKISLIDIIYYLQVLSGVER